MGADLKIGSVVRFRNRIWRVDRVDDKEFWATPLDGRDTRRWRFLRSLEEGDVRPGELPLPDAKTVSDPAKQDLLLRAYRLSLIHGSAPFLGLQRSRAIPEPFQLVPLLMSLDMPAVRLLIGDDVGVGKSVQAGLIVSELMARGAAERLLVVVPAALREQWQETLDRFFHLEAVIMAGHTRPALERQLLPGQSPWDAYPVIVTSIDYVKKRIGEVLAHRWDAVIVDEIHSAQRPHVWGGSDSSLQKERWEFLEAVGKSANVRHLIGLSATPHPGYTDCFASLLEVLNPKAVNPSGTINREIARKHVVQRRRKDIKAWYGAGAPFPERDPKDLIIPLTKAEKALFEGLRAYSKTLTETEGGTVGQWVSLHLQRRALSSPGAILASLGERRNAARKRISSQTGAAPANETEAESIVLDQDSTQDLDDESRWKRLDTAAITASSPEVEEIDKLIALAKKVTAKQDGKLQMLLKILPEVLKRHPRAPRALVFTRYKDTLDYLVKALEKEAKGDGPLKGLQVFSIFGDMNQKERRATYRAFETADKAVCIGTDCISEGLDLQRGCAELIHVELPWNPNRLEQRNGRLDRYGQPEAKVGIFTLVREDQLDIAILKVLVEKAGRIREQHGFCPIMFSSARELKRLIKEFGATSESYLPGFELHDALPGVMQDAEVASTERERITRIQDESFYGQEQIRLPQVEQALQQTYRTVGAPAEIRAFVLSALEQFSASALLQDDGTWKLTLRGTTFNDLGDELVCTFDPKIARDDPDLDLLDLAHPLVRRLVEGVQHTLAGTESGRVAARGSKEVKEVTAIVHILARFVTASEPPVLMEELIPLAFKPYGGQAVDKDPMELLRAAPQPHSFTAKDVTEAAAEALGAPGLKDLMNQAVDARRQKLVQRQSEIARMASQWAAGMDDVRVASVDLLTLTLLIPHG